MTRDSQALQFDYPPIKMVHFTGKARTAGVEEVERDGVKLRGFDVTRVMWPCLESIGWAQPIRTLRVRPCIPAQRCQSDAKAMPKRLPSLPSGGWCDSGWSASSVA